MQKLGYETSDMVKTEFGKSADDFCKQLAMRLIPVYGKQNDQARALQKQLK